MNLDSVRELKQTLATRVLPQIASTITARSAFGLDNVVVGFDLGELRFDNQIEIEGADDGPFSDGGDSGSLIVGRDKRAVALLFAGSDQGGANGQGLTYANPLRAVPEAIEVDLLLG